MTPDAPKWTVQQSPSRVHESILSEELMIRAIGPTEHITAVCQKLNAFEAMEKALKDIADYEVRNVNKSFVTLTMQKVAHNALTLAKSAK